MNEENLAKQEESVKKQEAMRRCKLSFMNWHGNSRAEGFAIHVCLGLGKTIVTQLNNNW